jgi:hypothetical protein
VTTWSLQAEVDMLETTTLADDDRSYVPGVRSFSGSATLLYYQDNASRNDAATLIKAVATTGTQSTTPIALTLRLRDGASFKDITLNAFVSSASYGANVGEVVSAQISFRGTGALTTVTI